MPKSPTFVGIKVSKIYHFSSEIIFGQLLKTFSDFFSGHTAVVVAVDVDGVGETNDVFRSNLIECHWASRAHLKRNALCCSVTRFSEISPFLQKFTNIWQIFDSLFLIWQNAEHTLANLWYIGLIFIAANGQILKNKLSFWSHCWDPLLWRICSAENIHIGTMTDCLILTLTFPNLCPILYVLYDGKLRL